MCVFFFKIGYTWLNMSHEIVIKSSHMYHTMRKRFGIMRNFKNGKKFFKKKILFVD